MTSWTNNSDVVNIMADIKKASEQIQERGNENVHSGEETKRKPPTSPPEYPVSVMFGGVWYKTIQPKGES